VQISPSTTQTGLHAQGFNRRFRVVANDAKLGGTLGTYAVEHAEGAKKIAVIDDRTAYGQGVADEFVKGAKKACQACKSSAANSPTTRPPTSTPS
jgi:branched-chain amino acid transport system substrate-binding protein